MKKHTPDDSDFAATFVVPHNVAMQVSEIMNRAQRSYPDHGESRVEMIQQELIKAFSKERAIAMAENATARDLAGMITNLHERLLEYETPAKPWWKLLWPF